MSFHLAIWNPCYVPLKIFSREKKFEIITTDYSISLLNQ